MTITKTIGFIGTGKMAEAILASLTEEKDYSLIGLELDSERRKYIMQKYNFLFPKPEDFFAKADIIVLAIKPQHLETVIDQYLEHWPENKNQTIISILAGTPSHLIQELINRDLPVIRVMPNTPALIGKGIAGVSFPNDYPDVQKKLIYQLLNGLGSIIEIPEYQMNAVTALSGSGPAYVYTFIQGLIDAGVYTGLTRNQATQLAVETVIGAASMIAQTGRDPISLRNDVTSPGGTTIYGLKVLEENGFTGILINAIDAAAQRAHELEEHS